MSNSSPSVAAAMADNNNNHLPEITNNPPPTPSSSTPSPSIPLHLSGFLTGDTIQVQGDTDHLQFSVQFNIHHKHNSSDIQSPFPARVTPESQVPFQPDTITPENPKFPSYSSSSSYRTPPVDETHEEQVRNVDAIEWVPKTEEADQAAEAGSVVTRLRSGVLTPVSYYPPRGGLRCRSWGKGESRKKGEDVLERVLRRHSLPIRPCSSYSFFVMSNWDVVEPCTFGEKSKRLGEMWSKLPPDQKQIFEEMAMKDNARYKRQCMLLAEEI